MIKSIENAENYTWGNDCDGWHLHKSDTLSVIQERMPTGTSEHLHFHHRAQQVFYILAGKAHFKIEGREILVTANQSIHIPAKTNHSLSNRDVEDLHFLVISEPKAHGDRVNL